MRTFVCFLWLIVFTTLFAESSIQEKRDLSNTLKLLRALGPKQCLKEVEHATSDRFTNLPKGQEIPQALKISYNSTFELFKKKKTHGHWNKDAFHNLMGLLHRQAQSNSVSGMSSELETLVKGFKLLDHFLTQQNFSRCSWEIARNDIFVVMGHFSRMTAHRKTYLA